MAVRQYIGARYVPTYYQNSLDPTSSEWEANVNYDPLTIVSLPNMHSYQSKKFVPSTIGSPASNPEYWYDQGYASAYYQALQDQIDDMKDGTVPGSLQDQINENASDIAALASKVGVSFKTIGNVATLITTDFANGDYVYVAGYYNAGDGGDGIFKISDTANGFNHALNNGLYANCINDDYVLPRYGGHYVDEMVDNLRTYLSNNVADHTWKHIILPPANKYHPGCEHFVENGNDGYFWLSNHPIVYDEHFAYSHNDFYGSVVLDKDSNNSDAIFKISDVNKPEDIYFNSLIVEGYHMGGVFNMPNHALLIEGSARANFQYLGAGYAKNCLTLGGANALNPIEINIEYAELGSATEKCIYCDSPHAVMLYADYLRLQNILTGCSHGIYNNSGGFKWHIGELLFAVGSGQTITDFTAITWKTQSSTSDLGIDVGRMRGFQAGTGKLIDISGNRTINTFGVIKSSSGNVNDILQVDGVATNLYIKEFHKDTNTQTIDLISVSNYNKIIIDQCDCHANVTGHNIMVNGINTTDLQSTVNYGIHLDTANSKVTIRQNGVDYNIN